MNYEQAKQLIKTKWDIMEQTINATHIVVHKLLDGNSLYCIVLYNSDNGVILTDYGNTAELFDLSEEQFTQICAKHNLTFEDWQIETPFNGLEDVENFISALDEIVSLN